MVSKQMFITVLYNFNRICWFMLNHSRRLKQAVPVPHQYFLANYQRMTAKLLIPLMTILTWSMLVRATRRPRLPSRQLVLHLMMTLLHPPHNLSLHLPCLQVIDMLLVQAVVFLGFL